jgi:hypothetical protein
MRILSRLTHSLSRVPVTNHRQLPGADSLPGVVRRADIMKEGGVIELVPKGVCLLQSLCSRQWRRMYPFNRKASIDFSSLRREVNSTLTLSS